MIDNILKKPKFLIVKFKENIFPLIFVLFALCLVIFSKENIVAVKNGLNLWINNVVPSLFPFFVATELLSSTNIISYLEKILNKFMRPVFNVSGAGAYPLIMGIISGYPVGAKIISNFRKENICSKEECERLLSFTNNSGPLFIISSVGIGLYYSFDIGILLFITHILACITVGFLFRFWKYNKKEIIKNENKTNIKTSRVNISNLGEILMSAIISSIYTIVLIGGFIVIFSVIISILNNTNFLKFCSLPLEGFLSFLGIENHQFSVGALTGLIELTNGVGLISTINCKQISINIIITAFLLGFGGFSIMLQVLSIISKTDISIKPYIIGKFMQGIFATIYTYIFISCFPMFNLNL